jgi:hypothetical protein
MNNYNPYQTLSYTAKYGSTAPKVKHTHYVVMYGDRILTKPMYYSGCQLELKQFKMQGLIYTNKTKFKIKGL